MVLFLHGARGDYMGYVFVPGPESVPPRRPSYTMVAFHLGVQLETRDKLFINPFV